MHAFFEDRRLSKVRRVRSVLDVMHVFFECGTLFHHGLTTLKYRAPLKSLMLG